MTECEFTFQRDIKLILRFDNNKVKIKLVEAFKVAILFRREMDKANGTFVFPKTKIN